jgi:hypothetical protein
LYWHCILKYYLGSFYMIEVGSVALDWGRRSRGVWWRDSERLSKELSWRAGGVAPLEVCTEAAILSTHTRSMIAVCMVTPRSPAVW